MNPVNGAARITAAMVAVSVTLSMVWSMAALGYPAKAPAATQLAAGTYPCAPKNN